MAAARPRKPEESTSHSPSRRRGTMVVAENNMVMQSTTWTLRFGIQTPPSFHIVSLAWLAHLEFRFYHVPSPFLFLSSFLSTPRQPPHWTLTFQPQPPAKLYSLTRRVFAHSIGRWFLVLNLILVTERPLTRALRPILPPPTLQLPPLQQAMV